MYIAKVRRWRQERLTVSAKCSRSATTEHTPPIKVILPFGLLGPAANRYTAGETGRNKTNVFSSGLMLMSISNKGERWLMCGNYVDMSFLIILAIFRKTGDGTEIQFLSDSRYSISLYSSLYARCGQLGFPRGYMRNQRKSTSATMRKKKSNFSTCTSRKKKI